MAIGKLARSARPALIGVAVTLLCASIAGAFLVRGHDLRSLAVKEGRLVIYSATDETEAADLLRAFRAAYPRIDVDYQPLTAREVYAKFKRESDAGKNSADVVINSAMDLQIKLVNDRYAQAYASPERDNLPDWAIWKNQAFAVSAEPIIIGYNRSLLPASKVPGTHDELATLLHSNANLFRGRIGSYDPSRSPTGYLYVSQDVLTDRDAWDLIGSIGRAQPRLFNSTTMMMNDVSSGKLLLAYNLIGSYAFERAAKDPNFGVIVPRDYVLMMSRVALIARNAPHPASAKLFLNFMLSRRGQALLAQRHMLPIRLDMPNGQQLKATNIRAVRVGPALMAGLDTLTYRRFIRKWNEASGSQLVSNK